MGPKSRSGGPVGLSQTSPIPISPDGDNKVKNGRERPYNKSKRAATNDINSSNNNTNSIDSVWREKDNRE